MKGDYGSMAWVNDESGKEYVCTVDVKHSNEKKYENLSEQERKTCQDVNQIVGTERWQFILTPENGKKARILFNTPLHRSALFSGARGIDCYVEGYYV